MPFTLADFIAVDRFYRHFAIVPPANYNDGMVPVPAALDSAAKSIPTEVPAILMVDDDGKLQRAIMDDRTILEVRRCRTMWHSLQELGGIHNSHAERLLAQERAKAVAVVTVAAPVAEAVSAPVATPAAAPAPEAVAPEPAKEESHGDGPYIETERCTSCNECTQVNNKMFQYNENKQAFIADPDAGTFRQLVEAAEGCQVSIIHPGKPRNPKEPGLEDLIQRAAPFN
ncbi:MAG: ferredoxin [Fimbriimonadales bacterium]